MHDDDRIAVGLGEPGGQLSQRSVPDPATFERANYIKTLASRTAPRR